MKVYTKSEALKLAKALKSKHGDAEISEKVSSVQFGAGPVVDYGCFEVSYTEDEEDWCVAYFFHLNK